MLFLVRWLINTVALLVVAHLVPGVEIESWTAAIVAALVLGIVNAVLKPVIVLITLPINILSLGLFTFIINAGMLYLSSQLVRGFVIAGFWSAFWGALLFSVVSFLLNHFFTPMGQARVTVARGRHQEHPRRRDAIDVEVVDEDKDKDRKKLS
jgi:putative membrane protein